jgi:signal peptidase I
VVFNCPHFKPDMDANRPVDKRTNYVKRCVAVGGDSLQVINGVVHINGQKRDDLRNLQHAHLVECSTSKFSRKKLREFGVSEFYDRGPIRIKEEYINIPPNAYMMFITDAMADKFRKMSNVSKVEKIVSPEGSFNPRIYPMTDKFPWNPDFYGPIYLPKVGDNIAIDSLTYPMYEWAIKKYENNPDLTWNEAEQKAYMNGKVLDSYTFKMNYYFMMGDNRDNSEDSRFWGFVPEDHIVGKPVFVWLSTDKNADSWFSWVRWGKSFRIPR